MTTQTIEVPDGYKIKCEGTVRSYDLGDVLCFQLKKIQPRRIVLEDTGEFRQALTGEWWLSSDELSYYHNNSKSPTILKYKIFREIKETDITLNSAEPKLSLSVDECRNVRSLIKDFQNLGWFINPERALLLQKITEFIKDK